MARPESIFNIGFKDYSKESARFGVFVTTLTAANLTAQSTLIDNLEGAVIAVTLGIAQTDEIVLSRSVLSGAFPTDKNAQRERKWLARYHDAVNNVKYQASIPNADLSILATNSDFADVASAEFIALKTAWELVVRSPDDNNLTILDSLEHVGRNT